MRLILIGKISLVSSFYRPCSPKEFEGKAVYCHHIQDYHFTFIISFISFLCLLISSLDMFSIIIYLGLTIRYYEVNKKDMMNHYHISVCDICL